MMPAITAVPNFFDEGSPFLNHPLLTAERTTLETDFIESRLNLNRSAPILDVGCGFGRHTLELARRGYQVTGIDPSAALIAAARQRSVEAGLDVNFRQERGEDLSGPPTYDAAVCLFTTLGQISQQGDNSRLVHNIYAVLNPGGRIMVEVPQRETAVRLLKLNESFSDGQQTTTISRSYDPDNLILTEKFRVVNKSRQRSYLLKVRLYDRSELQALLLQAGFVNYAAYAGYNGRELSQSDPVMLLIAEKGR